MTQNLRTNGFHLKLIYLPPGYIVYQCLETPEWFRSTSHKPRKFTASNGIEVISQNGPALHNLKQVAVHGNFRQHDTRPTLNETTLSPEEFMSSLEEVLAALQEV